MKISTQLGLMLLCCPQAWGNPLNNQHTVTTPLPCKTLTCVRKHIDLIDEKIVSLFGQRLAYAKQAGELKQRDHQPMNDSVREAIVLTKIKQQAEKAGYSRTIAMEVFKTIIVQTKQFEQTSFNPH